VESRRFGFHNGDIPRVMVLQREAGTLLNGQIMSQF